MPLWIWIPVVLLLWLASWIAGMNSTGSMEQAYAVWAAAAIATVLLGRRLVSFR